MKPFALYAMLLLCSVSTAYGHIEVGTWTGTTPQGAACSFVAGEQYFEDKVHHPLNERVPVEFNGSRFVMAHPAVVDTAKPLAFFNHDVFQSVAAIPNGAQALVIDMQHSDSYEGPTAFHFIDHNWRAHVATRLDCLNLKYQK